MIRIHMTFREISLLQSIATPTIPDHGKNLSWKNSADS